MARIFQRRHKIFLALAPEFFLRCFEVRDARCDFFPFQSGPVLLFGHAHSRLILCPMPIGNGDWGANWDTALRDCDGIAFAVDKTALTCTEVAIRLAVL